MFDPRIDSAAISNVQAAKSEAIEDARSDFIEGIADLVGDAIQAGVNPSEVRADMETCLSAIEGFEDNPSPCPGCGFNVDHDEDECPRATEAQIRAAVSAVMTVLDDMWDYGDTNNVVIRPDGSFTSPQSFGGTFDGSVKRDDRAVIGAGGEFYVVTLNADKEEGIEEITRIVAL